MQSVSLSPTERTLVISDLHIGVPGNKAEPILNFVRAQNPTVLVLNGDVFDIHYLKHAHDARTHALVEIEGLLTGLLHWLNADVSRRIVKSDGNHDPVWADLLRYMPHLHEDLLTFLKHPRVVQAEMAIMETSSGRALIIHGHQFPQGDVLWHLGEIWERHRGIPTPTPVSEGYLRKRAWLVMKTGFYWRMALWGKLKKATTVVHGHVHHPISVRWWGVTLHGLPCWKADEGATGGGALFEPESQSWRLIKRVA